MIPKKKALKLCQSFGMITLFAEDCNNGVTLPLRVAKQCALIVVDEVEATGTLKDRYCGFIDIEIEHKGYWQQVRTEIENL
jgi:hypothetical protein